MGKFQDEIDFAKELIKEDGDNDVKWFITGKKKVSSIEKGDAGYLEGADKPWLKKSIKSSDDNEDNVKYEIVDIVFLPLGSSSSSFKTIGYQSRSDIPDGSIMGIMAKQNFIPKLKDYIVRSTGEQLDVIMCDPISPDSDDIVYIMAFM